MNVARLLKMPCIVSRHSDSVDDGWGNPSEGWVDDSEQTLGWVDLRGRTTESSEAPPPDNALIETVDVYVLPDDTIDGHDRLKIDGKTYEILGPPHTFKHPVRLVPIYTHCVTRRVT